MGVKIKPFGFGVVTSAEFSDDFTRTDKQTLGPNWLRTMSNYSGSAGNSAAGFAEITSNTARMLTVSAVAPAVNYLPAWVPIPPFQALYNMDGVYVQATFQSAAGAGSALILRYNNDLNSGVTQAEGDSSYRCLLPGAAAGRIDKITGGGAVSTIGAGATTLVAGDLIRFECLTSSTDVSLRVLINGAILQTISDVSSGLGGRILTGVPGFMFTSISATGQSFILRDFACGPISRLSG
jgi:hypothetical protein